MMALLASALVNMGAAFGIIPFFSSFFPFISAGGSTSFLFEHRPDLLEGQEIDFELDPSEDSAMIMRKLQEKSDKEREIAESIPREVFDIEENAFLGGNTYRRDYSDCFCVFYSRYDCISWNEIIIVHNTKPP